MATADISISTRVYQQAIGTIQYGAGIHFKDGSWSQQIKKAVIVEYTETTTECRGLTSNALPSGWGASLTMATAPIVYGSTGNLKTAYFDYEKSSVQCEVHRVAECGFYSATKVERSGVVKTT